MKIQIEIQATATMCASKGKVCRYLYVQEKKDNNYGKCLSFYANLELRRDGLFYRCPECIKAEVKE